MALRRTLALVLASCLLATACDSGSDGGGGGGSTGSGTGGPPASNGSPRCVGKAVEAYTVKDPDTCSKQGSSWRSTARECAGTTFRVSCDRGDRVPSAPETPQLVADCLDIVGCSWQRSDGSSVVPTGRCEGTKVPCASLNAETCKGQIGCVYLAGECEELDAANYLTHLDCSALQIGNSVSFSVVRDTCKRAQGCTWVE